MNACPGETTLVDFVNGRLAAEAEHALDEHLDRCPPCRQLTAHLGRANMAPAELTLGTHAGRYSIVRVVGRGSMGTVYEAYDPKLDRKVALKTVYADSGYDLKTLVGRLGREARAVARLTHPNVISVFDVGEFENGQLFIAMELVDGSSLRQWSQRQATLPSWRNVRDLALAAGRGLAAAHAANLVHRDFKPDNILIGHRGEVRVTDFGLVKTTELGGVDSLEPLGSHQTIGSRATSLIGTPAYMAPEQLRGQPASALSDQFSYCVTVFETLQGERPFVGATAQDLIHAMETGQHRPFDKSRVPASVRAALLRGLSAKPEHRFADMSALLEALTPRGRPVTRPAVAAAAAVALAALGVTFAAVRSTHRCEGARAAIDSVWNEPSRARLVVALRSSGAPYAQEAARQAADALNEFSEQWAHERVSACEATTRSDRSPEQAQAQVACLERSRLEAVALVKTLTEFPRETVVNAASAARGLPDPASCGNPARWQNWGAAGAQLDTQLADARIQLVLGRHDLAAQLAERALARARELQDAKRTASALFITGVVRNTAVDTGRARAAFNEALAQAEIAHDDELKLKAWLQLASLSTYDGHAEVAAHELALGRAAFLRAGAPADLEGKLLYGEAEHFQFTGALGDAARVGQQALVKKLSDEDRGGVHFMLGYIARASGNQAEAVGQMKQVVQLVERALGPAHPRTGTALAGLADVQNSFGAYDEAEDAARRGYEILRENLGDDAQPTLEARTMYATALLQQERAAEACPIFKELTARQTALHADNENMRVCELDEGACLRVLGKTDEAVGHLKRAVVLAKGLTVDPLRRSEMHLELGLALDATGALTDAQRELAEALRLQERPNAPGSSAVLVALGGVERKLGQRDVAIQTLRRALERGGADPASAVTTAMAKFELARTLWGTPPSREEARTLLGQARAELSRARWAAREQHELNAWAAANGVE